MEYKNNFKNIFDEYKKYYECIFDVFYPSKNSTGFTERNLSVNFSKAYEKLNPKAITWFEFQFGEKNNLHYDALIINRETKELFLIESKRFSNLDKKVNEVQNDIIRIKEAITIYNSDFESRIPQFNDYTIYGIILTDVWTESKGKIAIKESFENEVFTEKYFSHKLPEIAYFTQSFNKPNPYIQTLKNYYLTSFVWKVR